MKCIRVLVAIMLLQVFGIANLSAQVILPYGQTTQQPWEAKYFTAAIDGGTAPADDWYTTEFNDSAWETVSGPLSDATGYYHATYLTADYFNYWVRRSFTLDSIDTNKKYFLYALHDDGCQMYLNGTLIYNNGGVVSSTATIELTTEQVALLVKGENLLAVKVSDSGGGEAFMDFGLEALDITDEGGIRYLGTVASSIIDNSLTEYVIKEGCTAIASSLFSGRQNITSITLPNSLKQIGDYAFNRCSNLKSINIPKNVESIGSYAFRSCYALDSLNFNAANCAAMNSNTFNSCNNLKTVIIGNDVKSIPNYLFYGHTPLQKVTIGDNVKKIGNYAFYNCSQLTTINIPTSCDSIGNNVFYGCSSLPIENYIRYADSYAIELTDKNQTSYTLKENTRFLGSELFRYCYYMTSVNIPSGVTAIGNSTFYECNALTSVDLPDAVKYIGNYAFYDCDVLTTVKIGSELKTIGNNAFQNCYKLQSLTLPDGLTSIGGCAFNNCKALASINIPSGVNTIERYTFDNCNTLRSLTLPDGVTSIGEHAFYNCSKLTSINIPSGVTVINNHTFYECSSLQSLTLPDGLTSIGEYAFYSCDVLNSINIPSGVTAIPNNTFEYCYALKEVTFPEGLISIGNYAFRDCDKLTAVRLPSGVTSIGNYAFYSCDRLRDLEIPTTLQTIGHNNLNAENLIITSHAATPPTISGGCSSKLIYVPAGSGAAWRELYPDNTIIDGDGTTITVNITDEGTLGEEVLKQIDYMYNINNLVVSGKINDTDIAAIKESMTSLVSIDLSGLDMETVPNSMLYNNRTLTKVILPNNAKEIGQEAFKYCTRLKEVTLPEGLEKINYEAFFNSGIETLAIPESVTEIGINAFDDCYSLASINIPDGVTRLEQGTFGSCRSLKSIELHNNLTYIGNYAFEGCSSLTSVTIPDGVTNIGSYAFENCNSLASVTLSKELTNIGYAAFRYCNSLKSIEIPSKVTTINSEAFYDCNKLETATILGATTIGGYAFYSCENLKEVTLPHTLSRCDNYIFNECYQLESVTCEALFPPTVENIVPNDNCVLYAPEWTTDKYKLAAGWSAFKAIEPITGVYPADISIYDNQSLTVDSGLPETYNPNMTLVSQYIDYWNQHAGKLTVRGSRPLTLSTFEMQQTRDASSMTVLLNKGLMSADSVVTKLSFQANRWHFLSFPYDVKVADIVAEGDWVVRYYDGELRAQGDYNNTWQNVPYDSILHAGEGYIWHSNNGYFEVPAMNNDNKNLIFSNETRHIQLQQNISSLASDNGWNLIGNPYPCYFDTRYLQFTSPITVRIDEYSYAAYSPVDDNYILSPLEAFFVQCSSENSLISFTAEGRQVDNTVREASAPSRTRGVHSSRRVFNLYLENESYTDHTRFVINEEAALNYEIAYDAAKFMSDDPAVQQLFTIENDERMAINERPMANGEVALGVYVGKAGSYTFSMDTKVNDTEVILVDKYTGEATDLTTSDYTFTSEAGTFTNRFVVCMKSGIVDGIKDASATAGVKVVTAEGVINVCNATAPVQVYNAAGALVDTKSGNDVTFEVAPGIYVVKIGTEAHKVSVVK